MGIINLLGTSVYFEEEKESEKTVLDKIIQFEAYLSLKTQGKLEVVKQEMARVNVNILGISKLRWTGMGEFNSEEHYIY